MGTLENHLEPSLLAPAVRRPGNAVYVSVLLHCIFLAWLIHSPAAAFISPSSIMKGENGTSVTRIYWPAQLANVGTSDRPSKTSSRHQAPNDSTSNRLTWTRTAKTRSQEHISSSNLENELAAARANPAPLAGSAFGSLTYGNLSGQEVRPAIRIAGSEPVLTGLADIPEGNEIVELTIDEQGNIIARVVVQSLGPAVDNAVLAALISWHFHPATRDGVVIPSKQDVYYHFPIRR